MEKTNMNDLTEKKKVFEERGGLQTEAVNFSDE